jgi:hypothetical protein
LSSSTEPSFAEVVAAVRPSVVGVRSALGAAGTGYVALDNGAVATCFECVGFEREAELTLEDGRTVDARVVAADVGRNLAVLAPNAASSMQPLRPAPELPALAAAVLALTRAADGELRVSRGMVSAVRRRAQRATIERVGGGAAVVVDGDGRLVGLCSGDGSGALVAAAAHAELLSQLRVAPAELVRMIPVYRCAACREALAPELQRCTGCGAAVAGASASAAGTAGAGALREVLSALGRAAVLPNARQPRVRVDGGALELLLDPGGDVVVFRTPVARLPDSGHQAVLRLLLTLNDETTGVHHLSLDGDTVMLSIARPAVTVSERNASALVSELVRHAAHYARVLAEGYGMSPVRW